MPTCSPNGRVEALRVFSNREAVKQQSPGSRSAAWVGVFGAARKNSGGVSDSGWGSHVPQRATRRCALLFNAFGVSVPAFPLLFRALPLPFFVWTHGFFGQQDGLGDVDELFVFVAGEFLQPPEGGMLVQSAALHEDSFGPLDDLAILQRFA